jgi:hypothetical protein
MDGGVEGETVVNADEVITHNAEPSAPDVPTESAGPSAETHGAMTSHVAGEVAPGSEPPVSEHSNGSPVQPPAGPGGDFPAAVADENGRAPAEVSEGDRAVPDTQAPDSTPGHAPSLDEIVASVSEDAGSPGNAPESEESVTGVSSPDDPASDEPSEEVPSEFDEPVSEEDHSERDAIRQQLVRQFETWLDRMDEGEPPPEGLPDELLADALETPEPADALGSDLYTVFAGLTKLSGEIGLQGRAFRQLADVLAPSVQVPNRLERLEAAQSAVARELARRAEPDEAELPASEDLLAVLFDLYDRLNRGLQNFDASYEAVKSSIGAVGFLRRLRGSKANADQLAAPAAAMREGYRLTLSRLEAAFLQWGIQRTGAVGEPFDPRRMAVVEVAAPAPDVPDGSVLEVYRSGYVLNGRVLATARVKVAKAGQAR